MLETLDPVALAAGEGTGLTALAAAEVDTELEEDDEDREAEVLVLGQEIQEIDEEQLDGEDDGSEQSDDAAGGSQGSARGYPSHGGAHAATPSAAPAAGQSGDYVVPAANREVWKQFGCDTEAGRLLRKLYKVPGQSNAAASVAYPRMPCPARRWEPKPAARRPCPQQAAVKLPRQQREGPDMDDPRNWRCPVPGRKPAEQILAEMEVQRPEVPNLPRGRNHAAEKTHLQKRFQYCGGRAMPKGAMGNVEASEALPVAAPSEAAERRRRDENGMNAEDREIFEEMMTAIQRKQERIKEIDAENAAEPKPTKQRTSRNKEALELRNDIARHLQDINKLMELTE